MSDIQLVTPQEAADLLRVDVRIVYNLIQDKSLPAARLGHRTIRIKRSDVDALIETTK